MEDESVPFLLVTANVGSVFEDPSRLLKQWIGEFVEKIKVAQPFFIALHIQEVGGKTYEKSMEYVQKFIELLCESDELQEYTRIRVFLDEDYNSPEHFTALGNLYLAKNSVQPLNIWNFLTHDWETVEAKNIHTGNIESVPIKEKSKFPQNFFPECKWSRKGFLRTRWSINGTVMDFVNIHLFHDASNLSACEEYPSVYCKSRRRALVHTLERFHTDTINGTAPFFVFGDFNFRCDTKGVVNNLSKDLTAHRIQNAKNDFTRVQYRDTAGRNVLTVGKKEFVHSEHETKFNENWLQQYDKELEPLDNVLFEYPITFPPSYPYEEVPTLPTSYMQTRCPSWCDRILMSPSAKLLIDNGNDANDDRNNSVAIRKCSIYGVIGKDVCMGDHKPIYLQIWIRSDKGIIRCHCFEHANSDNNANMNAQSSRHNNNNSCLFRSAMYLKFLADSQLLPNVCDSNFNNHNLNNAIGVVRTNTTPTSVAAAAAAAISPLPASGSTYPLVRINVIDTDNNLNMCMCSMSASVDNVDGMPFEMSVNAIGAPKICSRCQNLIDLQPTEHRRALISRKVTLANNIIVNRIDTHFLNTLIDQQQEPYTPESVESHSPFADQELTEIMSENGDNAGVCGDDEPPILQSSAGVVIHQSATDKEAASANVMLATQNRSTALAAGGSSGGGVSPRQLKSRLERLRISASGEIDLFDRRRSVARRNAATASKHKAADRRCCGDGNLRCVLS